MHKRSQLIRRQRDVPLAQHVLKRRQVKLVEVPPRPQTVVDLVEDRAVPGPPRIGEVVGVAHHTRGAEGIGDARAPVDKGSEDIENQCA